MPEEPLTPPEAGTEEPGSGPPTEQDDMTGDVIIYRFELRAPKQVLFTVP